MQENHQSAMQDNRPSMSFQHIQVVKTHHSSMSFDVQQMTLGQHSQQKPEQCVQQSDYCPEDSAVMSVPEVTGNLNQLPLLLHHSKESCREAEALTSRMRCEICQLQNTNEQLTQQLQTEVVIRGSLGSKIEQVHNVCVMLAERCERDCSVAIDSSMPESLRNHKADLESQFCKFLADYQLLDTSTRMEMDYLKEVVRTEHEKHTQEINEANISIKKLEVELMIVSERLQTEQKTNTHNFELLKKRENRIMELEHNTLQQVGNFQFQICQSSNALTNATSEIVAMKERLVEKQLEEKDYEINIKILEKEKSEMKERILSMERKAQKMKSSIDILVNEKNGLFLQHKESEYTPLASQNEKGILANKLEETHKSIQSLANENNVNLDRFLTAEKSVENLEEQNCDIVGELMEAHSSLDNLSSEKIKIPNELQETNYSFNVLVQENNLVTQDLQEVKCCKDVLQKQREEVLLGLHEAKLTIQCLENKESKITKKLTSAQQLIETLETNKEEILNKMQGVVVSSSSVESSKNVVFEKLLWAENAMNTLAIEKQEITEQMDAVKSSLTCIEAEKQHLLTRLREVEGTVNSLSEQKDRLAQELDDAWDIINTLEARARESAEMLASAEDRGATLHVEKEKVAEELQEKGNVIRCLEVEKDDINWKLSSAEKRIAVLELEKIDLLQFVKATEANAHELNALQEKNMELVKELESAKGMIKMLENEKEELSSKLQETESISVSMRERDAKRIKTLKSGMKTLGKEKTEVSSALESSETEMSALKTQVIANQAEMDKMRKLQESMESKQLKTDNELNTWQSTVESLKLERQEATVRNRSMEQSNRSLSRLFEESRALVKVLQNEKKDEICKAKDIQKSVDSYKKAFARQKKEMGEMAIRFETEENKLKHDRNRFARAMNHYKKQVKQLRSEQATKIGQDNPPILKSCLGDLTKTGISSQTPKKRVMFDPLLPESDSEDSVKIRRRAGHKCSVPSVKKSEKPGGSQVPPGSLA